MLDLDNLIDNATGVLGYGKDINVVVEPTDMVAFYSNKKDTITVDPELMSYYSDEDIKTVILHEVCHAAEYDIAEQNGLRDDGTYMREFRDTRGHTGIFKQFADTASEKLNDGVSVFKVSLPELSLTPDTRIVKLCEAFYIPTEALVCKIDYFDISIYDRAEEVILIKPKYYTGDYLPEEAFYDIADSLADGFNLDFDEVYEVAEDIWNEA